MAFLVLERQKLRFLGAWLLNPMLASNPLKPCVVVMQSRWKYELSWLKTVAVGSPGALGVPPLSGHQGQVLRCCGQQLHGRDGEMHCCYSADLPWSGIAVSWLLGTGGPLF